MIPLSTPLRFYFFYFYELKIAQCGKTATFLKFYFWSGRLYKVQENCWQLHSAWFEKWRFSQREMCLEISLFYFLDLNQLWIYFWIQIDVNVNSASSIFRKKVDTRHILCIHRFTSWMVLCLILTGNLVIAVPWFFFWLERMRISVRRVKHLWHIEDSWSYL